jgi:hypothetical protein
MTAFVFAATILTAVVILVYMVFNLSCPMYYLRRRRCEFNALLHGFIPVLAAAWAGRCRPGALRAGNGQTTAITEIDGETGRLVLAISIDPAAPLLHQVDLFAQL